MSGAAFRFLPLYGMGLKLIFILFSLFAPQLCLAQQAPVENNPCRNGRMILSGELWTQGQYCGGAEPTTEIEAEARQPQPAVGTWIYVRKGKRNNLSRPIVDSCKVDGGGWFAFCLKKGNYVLLLPAQRDSSIAMMSRKNGSGIRISDEACYREWLAKGWKQVSIQKGQGYALVRQTLRRDCFLPLGLECAYYDGPLPP
jgi:hypothetical protein